MHKLTLSTVRLEPQRGGGQSGNPLMSGIASGFFWRCRGYVFLVTNWHVVTGVNADTRMVMSFVPERLEVFAKVKVDDTHFATSKFMVNLLDDENQPRWLCHPKGNEIDCVVIPFRDSDEAQKYYALGEKSFEPRLEPGIGMECFIVGFPKGLRSVGSTPLWKRGSIASEPTLDHEGKPLMLVDAATREGMSGAPVLLRYTGLFSPSGEVTADSYFGITDRFIGIYSGRIEPKPLIPTVDGRVDEFGSQIGRVWKASVINEIIEHNRHRLN